MVRPDTNTNPRPLVLVAHGSRAPEANDAHVNLCRAVEEQLGKAVLPAFLELAEPPLSEAVALAVSEGATALDVLPMFLHPGRHTNRDIPELVERARRDHPTVTIRLLEHFGADPALIAVIAAQARR